MPKSPRIRPLVAEAKRRVAVELPEDEHDYTADWVYEIAIGVGLRAPQYGELPPDAQQEIRDFEERLRQHHRAIGAARDALFNRVREFVNEHGRNGSKAGREDYGKLIRLSEVEPLRIALDEYDRVATARAPEEVGSDG